MALCSLKIQTQIFNIYDTDEVKMQVQGCLFLNDWINKLFSEENKVPRTLFGARRVAGSAKYFNIWFVSYFKVGFFIHSWKQREC